jgi:GT2 family glycosyltransferase
VNYNSAAFLPRCLEALSRQEERGFRTVVVDNGSTDGSADKLEGSFPQLELVRAGRHLGFAAGNNLAASHARSCRWLITLNPDAFPEPGWLAALLAAARVHPQFAMFQARLVAEADHSRLDGVGDAYHVSGLHWRQAHMARARPAHDRMREIFSPCAAAAMYRRDAFDEVQGFDEDFFCYAEDVDLGFRLRMAGHRALYVPHAVVYHVGSGTTGRRSNFSVYHGQRNLVWAFVKNMPGPLLFLFAPIHLAVNLAAILVLAMRGQGGVCFRAKVDAVRGLRRMLAKRRDIQPRRKARLRDLLAQMHFRVT